MNQPVLLDQEDPLNQDFRVIQAAQLAQQDLESQYFLKVQVYQQVLDPRCCLLVLTIL